MTWLFNYQHARGNRQQALAGGLSGAHGVAMLLPRCPPAAMGGSQGWAQGPCFCICIFHLWLLSLRVHPGDCGNWEAPGWLFQLRRSSHGWERWGRQWRGVGERAAWARGYQAGEGPLTAAGTGLPAGAG